MSAEIRKTNPIVWWELRRIPFNIAFIIVAEISAQLIYLFAEVGPTEEAIHPFTILLLMVVINVIYTFVWISEVGNRRTHDHRVEIFKAMIYVITGLMMISPVLNFFRFIVRMLFH